MVVRAKEYVVETDVREGVVDVEWIVQDFVKDLGPRSGLLLVFLPHATASLVLNESEEGVKRDVQEVLGRMVPRNAGYAHDVIDNNAHAHVRASLVPPFVVLPVVSGRVVRGTWQQLMLVEHDGPRTRRVVVLFVGEGEEAGKGA